MSFFWRYLSLFRYFFIILICNCLWIILQWIFLNFCVFDIPLLYYFNLSSSIIFCISSRNIYLFLGISLSRSYLAVPNVVNFLKLWQFYQPLYYQSNHQFLLMLYEGLFWRSFKCIYCRFFSIIKMFLGLFIA